MRFRFLHDLCHGLHGPDRVFASRRFAGEHDGARAVVDSVCNVGDLRSRRARVVDHGLKHLRRRNDALAQQTALGNEIFLDRGQLCKRNLHAQIAPADHNAGALLTDFLHVVNAGLVFNLGDDLHVFAAVLVQKPPHIQHILLPRDKRRRDKINAVLNAEQQIVLVLFA